MANVRKKAKTIKTSVSLREDIYESAVKNADKYFQGNLSMFLGFCAVAFDNGLPTFVNPEQPEQPKEPKVKERLNEKSDFKASFISNILDVVNEK